MADKRFKVKNGLDNNNQTITGVGSNGSEINLAGNLTTSGANSLTLTTTGTTNVTLPTSGTLVSTSTNLGAFASTTSSQLAGVISDETGSGSLVFATSPSLTTPTLGVASATSVNKVVITEPATSATLTIADGKTLTASNTLTFTGTDSSSVAFGAGGTVAYLGTANAFTGANTFTNSTGQIFRQSSTQDGVLVRGRAGGTGSWTVEIVPTTLSANRTLTLANGNTTLQAGTMAVTGGTLGQFASTTSSALAGVISDETGSGVLVFGTSPSFTTSVVTGSTSFDVFNTTATTVNAFGAATTLAIGNTATAAQTVNMFAASTGASTYNFATGATANATTKTLNIGTGGAAGSTTNINIGSANGGTITVNNNLTTTGVLRAGSGSTVLTDSAGKVLSAALNTVAVAQGGTGLTSLGSSLQVLRVNSAGTALEYASISVGGGDVTAAGNNAFTGANTFTNTTGQIFRSAATQDGILLKGRAGGTSSYTVEIVPTTLSASRTLTLADGNTTLQAGTMATTGGTLAQFAATTSSQLAGVISDETGSGSLVFAISPSLTTPSLGAATATSINGLTITSSTGTLTVANGKTLTASNTLTFTGTDSSSVAFGTGGTVAYTANKLSAFAATTSSELAGVISDETGSGALVFGTSPSLTTPTIGGGGANFSGATSGTLNLRSAAASGTGVVVTIPATTGTLVTTGDTGTVTNTMLAGSIANNKLTNSSVTVNGTSIALGASGTITAANPNALTIGTGLSGTSYNGSSAVTIAIDSTVATLTGSQALTNKSYNGLTVTTTTGTLTIANGKTLTASNTLTFTGTDSSSVAFGAGGTVAYTSNNLGAFASTTSSQLAGVISDETGSGALVFGTAPTLNNLVLTGTVTANSGVGSSGQFLQSTGSGVTWATPFTLPSLTSGSVLFSNGTTIAQDNANFFWDDTNNRLGINTSSPRSALEVIETVTGQSNGINSGSIGDNNNSARMTCRKARGTPSAPTAVLDQDFIGSMQYSGYSGTQWIDNIASVRARVNGTVTTTSIPMDLLFYTGSVSQGTERMRVTSAGRVGIGTTAPNAQLEVVSTTEQLRLSYNSTNYFTTTVNSSGVVTFDAVGTAPSFSFSDSIQNTVIYTSQNQLRLYDGPSDYSILLSAEQDSGMTSDLPLTIEMGGAGRTLTFNGNAQIGESTSLASITFIIDGGGSAITTGVKGDLEIPFACTIEAVTMLADQTGSIVVDIWKDTYANYPPTVADTITASAKPTLSSANKTQNTTLTGWTKTINAGDTLRFNVDSATTVQRVVLSLKVRK